MRLQTNRWFLDFFWKARKNFDMRLEGIDYLTKKRKLDKAIDMFESDIGLIDKSMRLPDSKSKWYGIFSNLITGITLKISV